MKKKACIISLFLSLTVFGQEVFIQKLLTIDSPKYRGKPKVVLTQEYRFGKDTVVYTTIDSLDKADRIVNRTSLVLAVSSLPGFCA